MENTRAASEEVNFLDISGFIETDLQDNASSPDSKYVCETCLEVFGCKQQFGVHRSETCASKTSLLRCGACGTFFESKRMLLKHYLAAHNIKKYLFGDGTQWSNSINKRFECLQCDKSYKHQSNLAAHKRTHASANGTSKKHCENPFRCDVCGKSFKQKQQMHCHLLTHQNHRPFSCATCQKAFKLKQQLQNHTVTHTDLKPFRCSQCDKAFRLKQQLAVHFRVHDKLKPYQCPECYKRFSLKQNLNVHMFKHAKVRPFQCDECGKGFITKQNLNVHLKAHKRY